MTDLLPLHKAQDILLNTAHLLSTEYIFISYALGRILSQDIKALRHQPAEDMSAMDGYAIRYDPNITTWDIIGECKAGHPPCQAITSGQAARIFTGALLPKGADTIVIQEDIKRDDMRARLIRDAYISNGQHIRKKGYDFKVDDIIAKAGDIITPTMIGQIIAAGYNKCLVYKKPQIAIISTGDELQKPGTSCLTHQIPASNGPMIAAMLQGCDIVYNENVTDDMNSIIQVISHYKNCDIIITIGGASVGDHDLILPALDMLKADISFMKVAIKPGKPIMTGKLDNTHIIGLPGNPASAYVTAILFLLPLIRAMNGMEQVLPFTRTGKIMSALPATGPRVEFLRAIEQDGVLKIFNSQDSGKISTLSQANALIIRNSNSSAINPQEFISYIAL